MIIKEVINYLEMRFPKEHASDFDKEKIGLIIGDDSLELSGILLTLDLNMDIVKEAIKNNVNFIISHHPFIFNPLYKIHFNSNYGKILEQMFKHKISLFAMHTNYDVGKGGVNDFLASLLKIKKIEIINNQVGKENFLRYGDIEEVSLKELALFVKNIFQLSGVKVCGDLNKRIKRIGIVGGSGAHPEDIENALKFNLDCYITGEIKLNIAQHALSNGLSLIEVNHGIEKLPFIKLQQDLLSDLSINNVLLSSIQTDPLVIV